MHVGPPPDGPGKNVVLGGERGLRIGARVRPRVYVRGEAGERGRVPRAARLAAVAVRAPGAGRARGVGEVRHAAMRTVESAARDGAARARPASVADALEVLADAVVAALRLVDAERRAGWRLEPGVAHALAVDA